MTEQTTTPTLTADAARDRLDAALTAYRAANETITLTSLLLLATGVRDEFGDSATGFVAEWSDQGDYLSSIVTVERGPEGAEDYEDGDLYASNLDGGNESVWRPFATETAPRSHSLRFDVARILAEIPPLLDATPEPAAAPVPDTSGGVDTAALLDSIAYMADVLGDGMTASDVGSHMTCGEAETVADVLRAAGHPDAAESWIAGHADGDDDDDDPEDMHHDQRGALS